MEIKIVCTCGTKFKFDVEPVHARMPAPVNCPGCGADATAQANAIIESSLAAAAPVAAPAPVAPAPTGLRINRAAAEAPGPVAVAPAGASTPPPTPPPIRARQGQAQKKAQSGPLKIVVGILSFAVAFYGSYCLVSKWTRRANLVAQIASAAGSAGVDQGEFSHGPKNLWYEKCAILFVQHTNHLEVAKACQDYWKTKLHKNLVLLNAEEEAMNPGEYELIPAHNGYVRVIGAFEWPVAAQEGLAQHLSQTFTNLVFEFRTESFADTYHFGVYDQGARKFHAQMDIKMTGDDAKEIVTTEGNEYALAHGFKPGPEGFKNFDVLQADQITQKLGMKLWDEKEGTEIKGMMLKESAAPANR